MAVKEIRAGRAFVELGIRDSEFVRGLDRSISKMRAFSSAAVSLGRDLAFLGGAATGALVVFPLKLAANLEVSQAAFTAMTGSAVKAKEILDGLQQFAGESTFDFQSLQNSARTMLNFGIRAEQVLPLMRQLGAIALGDSDRLDRLAIAFGQTAAKGRLMAEEVRQMVNAGFNPLQEISRTTGRSMGELIVEMEKGNISAEDVADAFESVTGATGRFGKILSSIQNTAFGQFRKALAAAKIALTEFGGQLLETTTDFLKQINKIIPEIARFVRQNANLAKSIAAVAITTAAVGTAFVALGTIIRNFAIVVAGAKGAIVLIFGNPVIRGIALVAAAVTAIGVAAKKAKDLVVALAEQLGPASPIARAGRIQGALTVRQPAAARPPGPPINFGNIGQGFLDAGLNSNSAKTLQQLFAAGRLGIGKGQLAVGGALSDLFTAQVKQRGEQIAEGERLDAEIGRLRIQAIKDEEDRDRALIEFERKELVKKLQREGLATQENLIRVNDLAAAQAALVKSADEIGAFSLSTFGSRFAQQALGISAQDTGKQTVNELKAVNKKLHKIELKKIPPLLAGPN